MDRVNDVKGCFGDGTNNTDTRRFTAGAAPGRADAVPDGWVQEFVRIVSVGADSSYFFSTNASATCDPTTAATNAGSSAATQGEPLLAGVEKTVLIPNCGPGQKIYFVRASAGAVTYIAMTKASGKPGNNTVRDG